MIIKLAEHEIEEAIKLYIKQELGKGLTEVNLCDAADGSKLAFVGAVCIVSEVNDECS